MIKNSISAALDNPFGFGWLLSSSYLFLEKLIEITIFSNNNSYPNIARELNKKFIPNGLFAMVNEKGANELEKYSLFKDKTLICSKLEKDSVMICKDLACSPPLTDLKKIEEALSSANTSKERIK
jgi:uncharacterized protein YyaL (SSP411 family)